MTSQPSRLLFADRLRSGLVLAVIVFHAAVAYLPHAPPDWFVLDGRRSPALEPFAALGDLVAIPALFFLAGYFGWRSLKRYGPVPFLHRRLRRLGLPFAAGLACVVPLTTCLRNLTQGRPASSLDGLVGELSHFRLDHGHLWFLPCLLAFSAALAACRSAVKRVARPGSPPWAALGVVWLAASAATFAAKLALPDDRWVNLLPLNVAPTRIGVELALFAFGAVSAANGWLEGETTPRTRWAWLVTFAATCVLYLALLATADGEPAPLWKLAASLTRSSAAISFVVAVLQNLRAHGGRPISGEDSLHSATYGMYVVHYPIVLWLNRALLDAPVPALAKLVCVSAVGIASSWAAARLATRVFPSRPATPHPRG